MNTIMIVLMSPINLCRIIFAYILNLFRGNTSHVCNGNSLRIKGVVRKRTSIKIEGNGNHIKVEGGGNALLDNCSFFIFGNNNTIHVGKGCKLYGFSFYIEDSNGVISIGDNTCITGNTHLLAIEGTSITIGKNCLFSQNITFRTGDSHSILNLDGKRINPSKNIVIGNHVWIGHTVTLLKGTEIGDNSVIASGSILAGGEFPCNCVVGGIGGRILKSGISWCEDRVPIN